MIPTKTFKAIVTESGKWVNYGRDEIFTDDLPALHKHTSGVSASHMHEYVGEPCTVVDVALVDPEYLACIEAMAISYAVEYPGSRLAEELKRIRAGKEG